MPERVVACVPVRTPVTRVTSVYLRDARREAGLSCPLSALIPGTMLLLGLPADRGSRLAPQCGAGGMAALGTLRPD